MPLLLLNRFHVTENLSYLRKLQRINSNYLVGYWPFNESSGPLANDLVRGNFSPYNIIQNYGFEIAGSGGADIWSDWTESVSDGTLTDDSANARTGSGCCKITAGVGLNTYI